MDLEWINIAYATKSGSAGSVVKYLIDIIGVWAAISGPFLSPGHFTNQRIFFHLLYKRNSLVHFSTTPFQSCSFIQGEPLFRISDAKDKSKMRPFRTISLI